LKLKKNKFQKKKIDSNTQISEDSKTRMNYMINALTKKMSNEIKTETTQTKEIVEGGKSKKDMSKMIELLGQHMTEEKEETKAVIIEDEKSNESASSSAPLVPSGSIPPVPTMSNVPSVPSVPSIPNVPSVPNVPAVPKFAKMSAPKKYVKQEKAKEEKKEEQKSTKKEPTVDLMSEMKKVILKKAK